MNFDLTQSESINKRISSKQERHVVRTCQPTISEAFASDGHLAKNTLFPTPIIQPEFDEMVYNF